MTLALLPLDDPRWTAFAGACPDAGPFHHPAWASLLADCYGFRPFALGLAGADGALRAGLPVLDVGRGRWVSLPFTDACAPLGDRAGLAAVLGALPRLELHAALAGPGLSPSVRGVTHALALDRDAGAVRSRFHSQMRRNVARAERERLVVRPADSEHDLVGHFYDLHLQTRRRQGVPVQPRRFFRLLWERLIEPGLGTTLLVLQGTTPVAGAVFLEWNGTVVYKFGASDPAAWALRPNNLLFWEAIRAACERGDRTFDFGRTDLGNHGLRQFKTGWGAVEQPLVYTFAGPAPGEARGRAAAGLELAIRRSPPWVCRAIGELAYKYAA
jgi:CelD/BcsL family acetyltransferase involved in cellulose biosynthesis